MDSGRLMISSAASFCATGGGGSGGQVLLFGGGGGFCGVGSAPMAASAGAENGRRKRPCLTAHEELRLDQLCGLEYELQGVPEKTKRRLTAEQVQALEVSFEEEKQKLEPERKRELARRLGIAPRQVAVWFQNRRARWRTKQLEQDFYSLRVAHDVLLAGRDALVADNDRLQSQVINLTEQLQAKEQTAPPAATGTTAMEAAVLLVQLDDDQLRETISGEVWPAQGFPGGANSASPESYFAGAPSPPSSSEGDCGDEGSAPLLPDAMLLAVAAQLEHGGGHDAGEDSWEWFWNRESPGPGECTLETVDY